MRSRALVALLAAAILAPGAAGQNPPSPAQPRPVVVKVDRGFDWVDAAVGAAGAIGVMLVVVALVVLVRNGTGSARRLRRATH